MNGPTCHKAVQQVNDFGRIVGLYDNGDGNYRGFIGTPSSVSSGDYNGNGVIDAGDYTIWRDTHGSLTNLTADGNHNNQVDTGDYVIWRNHFGQAVGAGAGSGSGVNASDAVPEPTTLVMLFVGMLPMCSRRQAIVS